jgi:hypothetical protein
LQCSFWQPLILEEPRHDQTIAKYENVKAESTGLGLSRLVTQGYSREEERSMHVVLLEPKVHIRNGFPDKSKQSFAHPFTSGPVQTQTVFAFA